MTELKPCPFCRNNSAPEILPIAEIGLLDSDDPLYEELMNQFTVICNYQKGGCGASCGTKANPGEAIEAWNRRAEQ